jgi:hypothetical protein
MAQFSSAFSSAFEVAVVVTPPAAVDPGRWRMLVRKADRDFDKSKRREPEYDFGERVFSGRTSSRGPYED